MSTYSWDFIRSTGVIGGAIGDALD